MQMRFLIFFFFIISFQVYAQPITYTESVVNAKCGGGETGSAQINITSSNPPYTFSWSNGDTDNAISGVKPGSYTCTITDGLSNTLNVTVTIKEDECSFKADLYFTPNGDGYNDHWNIGGINEAPEPLVIVYNRMGQKVFQSKNGPYEPWDGKDMFGVPVPDATYFYIIYSHKQKDEPVTKGSVSILR